MLHAPIAPYRRLAILAGIAMVFLLARPAAGGGIPLVDAGGGVHGSVKVTLARGLVAFKIAGLAPLPAEMSAATPFMAHEYKAYLSSSTDPAVEVFLGDIYPNARQQAARRIALGGDVSRMGFDRVVIMAFSKTGQDALDVLTATLP